MNFELGSDLLAREFLQRLDPQAKGAFIEVGLGTGHFSFSWAAPLGFTCVAVEALPSESLQSACAAHRIKLVSAAMAEQRGEVPIYFGELNGVELSEVSSLNPRWWGSGKKCRLVPSLALVDLLDDCQIEQVSFFKVDTEGSELRILKGLLSLPAHRLPALVLFEYGGGSVKSSGQGGWTPEFFGNTQHCLSILQQLGYQSGLIIEQALPEPQLFQFKQVTDLAGLFSDQSVVGNILVSRSPIPAALLQEIMPRITPELAAAARRDAARQRREKFNHYKNRVLGAVKRRLLPARSSN